MSFDGLGNDLTEPKQCCWLYGADSTFGLLLGRSSCRRWGIVSGEYIGHH